MEGAPSFRKKLFFVTIQMLIVTVSFGLWDLRVILSGRWNWGCTSQGMASLAFGWVLVNSFGLGLTVQAFVFYLLTKDLRDKVASKNWRYLSLLSLSGILYYYLMAQKPSIVSIFFLAQTDTEKLLLRILVVPILGCIGFINVNWASKKLKLHDPSDSVCGAMVFLLIAAFYSRFLQNSLSTYGGTILCNVLVGLQEIFMRFTIKARGKVFAKYVLWKSDAELAALEVESATSDEVKKEREYTARLIVVEMVIEYVAILLAPLLTVFNQVNSVDVHLGYDADGSYDVWLLVFSAVSSLILELLVDTICFKVQEKWFSLRLAWDRLTEDNKLWTMVIPNLLLATVLGSLFMLAGFTRMQQDLASDKCAFLDNCMPDPCVCYSSNSTTVDVLSHVTGKNVSLALPPLFDTLCHQLDQINNNGTAMTIPLFKNMYIRILTP
jgi:hypothetical protein